MHLRKNDRLRENFFSRVKLLQYAGAGLAPHVFEELQDLAVAACGERVTMITGYGSTETAPFAFSATRPIDRPGMVGLPAPGLECRLLPNENKWELRLRGPSITPGYWRQPDVTAASFDEEGYYRIGDALKFIDEDDPGAGFLFDGRIAEDFKLATGTWVNMAAVRGGIVAGFAPFVRDAVLAGADRNYISALLFPDFAACRALADDDIDDAALATHPALLAEFQARLDTLAARATGSSTRVVRAIVLADPPSIDAHELTDKGSINQRAVLAARAALADDLYADPAPAHVLTAKESRP
jgi:feruloyl-CoA synthase